MAVLEILKYPDPRLSQVSSPVTDINSDIRTLVDDMIETMYVSRGVGLAAPQVGHFIRLLVVDPSGPEEKTSLKVLINPQLTFLGDTVVSPMEGCLSVPYDYRADVKRFEKVTFKAQDLDGNFFEEELEGFEAIVLQHEFDHLEGKLFIDHIGRLRRTLFDTRVKKLAKKS